MNDRTESGSSFVAGSAGRRCAQPRLGGPDRDGRSLDVDGRKVAGRSGECFSKRRLDRIPEALDNVRSGLKESAGSVTDAAASTLDAVRERGASTLDNVADYGRGMPEPGAVFDTARDGLSELFRAQPLALGAIGLAIGAGIAAALPKTDVEDAYLGEVSQTVKTQAAEIAGQQVDKATALASDVVEAASAEARKQGLTPDGAKAAVDDITGRVGRVVDAAKNSVGEKQF